MNNTKKKKVFFSPGVSQPSKYHASFQVPLSAFCLAASLSRNKTKQITNRGFSSCCHFIMLCTLQRISPRFLGFRIMKEKWNYANICFIFVHGQAQLLCVEMNKRKERKVGRRRGGELKNKTAHDQCKSVQKFIIIQSGDSYSASFTFARWTRKKERKEIKSKTLCFLCLIIRSSTSFHERTTSWM